MSYLLCVTSLVCVISLYVVYTRVAVCKPEIPYLTVSSKLGKPESSSRKGLRFTQGEILAFI